MDAEEDHISLRKRFDPIPHRFNNADVLIPGMTGIIGAAKVIHQAVPLSAIGHARIVGANQYLGRDLGPAAVPNQKIPSHPVPEILYPYYASFQPFLYRPIGVRVFGSLILATFICGSHLLTSCFVV
jgi:hypothetical protein